ncbi:MAG: DnaJ C-terminal domain-containing protein [Alphaproteobacteria bacterium]
MRDPYEVLGVSRKASDAEIKKAFRALAKKHHPDRSGNDPATVKRFQEINSAYELLSDKEKRAQFDRGEIDASGQPKGFGAGFRPGAGGYRGGFHPGGGAREFRFDFGNGDVNVEDILGDIFGSFAGGMGRGRPRAQPRRGQDLQLQTTVSFQEAALGGTRRVSLADGRELEVRIPAGLKDGQTIRLRGQGVASDRGGQAGDLLITVSVAPHPFFARDGEDIRMDLPITLKEAVLGAKVEVPTLTGPVAVTVPPNSNTGNVLRLKGKGIQTPGKIGDLYVRLLVTLPDRMDSELESFARRWGTHHDPRTKLH